VYLSCFMPLNGKRWIVAPPLSSEAELNLVGFPPILRQILNNRGFTTANAALNFLDALPPPGNEPRNLSGMLQAVERIRWAIQKQELIAIYGDYDADGVTATALLTHALRSLDAIVIPYIPNRFDEGYGLNVEALDSLRESGVRLVITVDCGIRSMLEAEHAQNLGLDMIITDHHQPGSQIPLAKAVINPKQPDETYPDENLAGVGLSYKLALALFEKRELFGSSDSDASSSFPRQHRAGILEAEDYLDLVALGTVADLVPLLNENRALVRAGLEYLRRPHRQGVMSLIGAAQLHAPEVTTEHIRFMLAPRLNAAGRLESAQDALNLLLTEDVAEAAYLAQKLDDRNRERQQITQQIQLQAEQIALAEDPDPRLLFAEHEDFNPGVIGLAASRLCEQYYRPAIVAHRGEELTRGSCRSIAEFHITCALDECSDILVRHGGHAAAAGFTVRNQDLPELKSRLKSISQRELACLDLRPTLKADTQVTISELRPELLNELARLQPTGNGNPPALFVSRDVKVIRSKLVGKDNAHLKLTLTDGRISIDAIAFRQGYWQEKIPSFIDLIYNFEINVYNGRAALQLNVRDLKPAGTPD
jgi:single-stranded-DNA-specific exonuclease